MAEVLKNKKLTELERFKNPLQAKDWIIENQQFNKLNKLKKSNAEAFFYWYITISIFIKNNLVLSNQEFNTLSVAIDYYKSRKGGFSREDPLLLIKEKFNSNNKFNSYNEEETSLMLKVVKENIAFMDNYEYKGLSQDEIIANKQAILNPLFNIRKRILNITK